MAESNSGDLSLGYMMGQSDSGNNNGGFGGFSEGLWAVVILAMLFNGGGFGFGGFGGGASGALTRAELYDGFAIQNIDSAVRGVQNGIADSTYAITNAVTSGFHGVDNALCNMGYNIQNSINGISREIGDCCCTTQRAIDSVNYNMATQFCNLGNTMQSGFRDIIDSNRANTQQIMDFLVNEKLASKDAQIVQLQNQVSQANQTAAFRAAIDASTAEIIRRTGNDCPTPAYWVSPPTPVPVPYQSGCGCGC